MALPKYSLAFKYHMRLLICFYIVLGLFELFQGLTHGIQSKFCLWNSSLEKGNQSQMSFLVEAGNLCDWQSLGWLRWEHFVSPKWASR